MTHDLADRVCPLSRIDHRADTLGYQTKINRGHLDGRQAESGRIFHGVVDPGRADQGFAGHTAEVQAVPTQFLFTFDQQGLGPQLSGAGGHGQTGRPPTDDTDVVVKTCHKGLPGSGAPTLGG